MHLIQYRQAMAVVRLPAGRPARTGRSGRRSARSPGPRSETSVICPTSALPDALPGAGRGAVHGVRVAGTLDFSQTGVLSRLLAPLADAGVPVFTVSTFDTDWILVRAKAPPPGVRVEPRLRCRDVARRAAGGGGEHERHRSPRVSRRRRRRRPQAGGGPDVALVVNDGPRDAAAAAVFTDATGARRTRCCGASRRCRDGGVRAVVLNSGGANCYTGAGGLRDHPRHRRAVAGLPAHRRRSTSWSAPPG